MQGVYVLHIFSAGTYLSLAAYVLARNWRARLNWITAAVNLCFALWSASLAVSHYPGSSREVAALAYDVGSLAWGSMASISCLFIGAFMRPSLLRSKVFLTALIVPAVLTISAQWGGYLAADYVPSAWGYRYVWRAPGAYFFFAYYGAISGSASRRWYSARVIYRARSTRSSRGCSAAPQSCRSCSPP